MNNAKTIVAIFGGSGALGDKLCALYDRNRLVSERVDGDFESGTWHVISLDKNPPPQAVRERFGERLTHIPVDVLDDRALEEASRVAERDFGRLTHIVSLVGGVLPSEDGGFGEFNGLKSCSPSFIRATVNYNLIQHLMIGKFFFPLLEKDPGPNKSVVLMSSINTLRDYGNPIYTASKGGLESFMKAMAGELGKSGIRINCILPGTVPNERTLKQPKNWDVLRAGTALGEFATEDDIAGGIWFLLNNRHIMGDELVIDSGQSVVTPNFVTTKPATDPNKPSP